MSFRSLTLGLLLGVPAVALLAFGPRGQVRVPADRTRVTYWEKWTGVEGAAMQRLVSRFNETEGAAQGIWVDYQAVSNVDQRMLIATAGGDPPDLAGLYDYIVPQFADQDALLPLDALAPSSGIRREDFKPIWWNIGLYDGRLFALPSTPYTAALYYNRALFRAAGLDPDRPPRTIAELDDYALRLTRRAPDGKIVQLGFTPAPAMLGWWHWIWPFFFDARLWDGSAFHLATPEGLAAFNWIAAQRAEDGVQDLLDFEATAGAIEGAQNPFLSGRLAMLLQGPWVSNWIRTYAPSLDYAVAPFPSVSAERRNVFASADVFVIPRGSRHVHEAMSFLAWVLRREVMEELCTAHGKVSPYQEPGPDFFARHPDPFIRIFDDLARSEYAFGYPRMPMWSEASTEMLFLLENVLRGVEAADDAVASTQTRVEKIVRSNQELTSRRRRRTCALRTAGPSNRRASGHCRRTRPRKRYRFVPGKR